MSKSRIQCYRYTNDGEWATIAVCDDWFYDKSKYHGEILIHSSYGNFCNSWINTGIRFKQFLINIPMESFGNKTMGKDSSVIDWEATQLKMFDCIGFHLLDGYIDDQESHYMVREIADQTIYDTNEFYCWYYQFATDDISNEKTFGMESPGNFLVEKPNPQLVGFWNKIWPLFIDDLNKEEA